MTQTHSRAPGQAMGLASQLVAGIAFYEPELLSIGEETLVSWIDQDPRLADMGHYIEGLFKRGEHIRSAEIEEVLGMLADTFGGLASPHTMWEQRRHEVR